MNLLVRSARSADGALLRSLHDAARTDLVGAGLDVVTMEALLAQQHLAQELGWDRAFPALVRLVLVRNGEAVGRLYLAENPAEVRLVDLAVLPDERGRGIGAGAVRLVQEWAGDRPVILHVTHGNPARRLYERAGFRADAEDEARARMTWSLGSDGPTG